jgi:preprotein translocase subunit SecY
MSSKEPISILNASAKTHYIAIGIFTILFGLFYVFMNTDQFKDIRTKMEKWRTSILGYKKNDDIDDESSDDESDSESENEIDAQSNNIREVLSPF